MPPGLQCDSKFPNFLAGGGVKFGFRPCFTDSYHCSLLCQPSRSVEPGNAQAHHQDFPVAKFYFVKIMHKFNTSTSASKS